MDELPPPLRPNWFHILLSLSQEERHGYAIMQDVLERTDGRVRLWPTTLYGTLRRLLDEGLIEESRRRPDADEDDARRVYYRLTGVGQEALDAECERLEAMVRAVRATRRPSRLNPRTS